MKEVFAKLGVPNVIVSDGGPQYASAEFKDFMKHWQIEHRVSSPRNPQSNGMAEHYVQTTHQDHRGRGRCGSSTINIQDYTPESQTAITSRITELKEVQDSITNPYSTNKTAGKLQKNHGPRKASTGTIVIKFVCTKMMMNTVV